ncbi:CDGSH iron-sulfur domain-containing protein [Methanolobus sp. WCC4]|uniref:CDGSH iron-sulfur domain-containing protein n=1 Tax=Methanolobus sp. WCC4 TaxID=3125784 RepID=UPI0030F5A514
MKKEVEKEKKPAIKVSRDGPFIVRDLKTLRNSKGTFIETVPVMALCRCGASKDKPFCDGAHTKNELSGEKEEDRVPDRTDSYVGENITVHHNKGVCSHIGNCILKLPEVFRKGQKPWVDTEAAKPEEIAKVIRSCPSGSLSYTINGELHKDYPHEPEIFLVKNGPYHVVGGIELDDPDGSKPETKDHYALCRCGASKNKPFCDGTHLDTEFRDRIN